MSHAVLLKYAAVKEAVVSTNVRIVFVASAKSSNGMLLHDILGTGVIYHLF